MLITGAIDLPFSIYRTFVIEARFGFNRMTPALFVADLAKQVALGARARRCRCCLLRAVADGSRWARLWWLYVWLAWMAFNLLMLLAYPTLIAPLFNKFTPLEDAALADAHRAAARALRVPARAACSSWTARSRSSHGNAYFTGFGAAKRIVFFDTLLARLAPAEVEAVLAHELGHFKLHHVWKRIALAVRASPRVPGAARLAHRPGLVLRGPARGGRRAPRWRCCCSSWWRRCSRSSCTRVGEPLLAPARVRGRRLRRARTRAPRTLVKALVKLYQDNAATLTPDPLHSAFYDSHPPAALRIARLQAGAT